MKTKEKRKMACNKGVVKLPKNKDIDAIMIHSPNINKVAVKNIGVTGTKLMVRMKYQIKDAQTKIVTKVRQ